MSYFESFSLRQLLLHPAIWLLAATGVLVVGSIQLWHQHRLLLDDGRYELSLERVSINAPPVWLAVKPRERVYAGLPADLDLLSPNLVPATVSVADSLPWVRGTTSATKNHAGIAIEAEYRRPIGIIERKGKPDILFDADGFVFDREIWSRAVKAGQLSADDLMRISLPQANQADSESWQQTPDRRIQLACRLIEFLQPHFRQLELYRVVTFDPPATAQDFDPQFELWTKNGTRVIWGSAFGGNNLAEATQSEKLAALSAFAVASGPLRQFAESNSRVIDVRNGAAKTRRSPARLAGLDIEDSISEQIQKTRLP